MNYIRFIILILTTGIVGGLIAFLGNQLGRYVGRKKMSVFKLRPRYTSMLITVLTGMMIASSTLGLAIILSEPVRIVFINPREYQKKVKNLEDKIKKLSELQQTDLVYKRQDIIVSAVIKADSDAGKMRQAIKELISEANKAAILKSEVLAKETGQEFLLPPDGKLVGYIPENLEAIVRELSRLQGEFLIFVRAFQHCALGEGFAVEIGNPIPNDLIFFKGEPVHKALIDGSADYFAIYDDLLRNIKNEISTVAIARGLFPNPEDRSIGEFDEQKLKELAKEIKKLNRKVTVEFFAKENTYTLGPLQLDFSIKN